MSIITITISIDVPDGATVNVGTSNGGMQKPTGKARRDDANEVIPPGGSTDPLPGKKGLTIGQAPRNDLLWWADKIAAGLRSDPNSRFADSNREQLAAIEHEMERRASSTGSPAFDSPPPEDDDIPFD